MINFLNSIISNNQKSSKNDNILIVVFGESNSGGYALNSDVNVQPGDLDQRTNAYIFDNVNNDSFDLLKCGGAGQNNLFEHAGLSSTGTHGLELEIGLQADNGSLIGKDGNVYILKAGQGGTRITHWVDGTIYSGVNSWQELQDRMTDAFSELNTLGVQNLKIYVMFSLGINDAISQTDPATWRSKTQTLISNFRNLYNFQNQSTVIKFFATQIMPNNQDYIDINNEILTIASSDSDFVAIQTSDATLRDSNHWDYAGLRLISSRMLSAIKLDFY